LDDPSVKVANESDGYAWDEIAGVQGRLEQSIGELPEEQRDVLHKFYIEDKSHSTIAKECSLAIGTVKSRLRLALTSLRRSHT
jgi:RNA polymerase sigma-70 factor (ECF subfamily)